MPELIDPGSISFEAPLQRSERSGAACWVDFPHELKELYGKGNLVPVRATWDGRVVYRGSLAMMGGTLPMLLCRKDVLAQLGKDVGDVVHVMVELDVAPREVVEPEALMAALQEVPGGLAAWTRLTAAARRDYAAFIDEARQEETRRRRIERAVPRILAGQRVR